MPHTQGSLSNAKAMLTMGTQVESVEVPVQFFTTAGDELSETEPGRSAFLHQRIFEAIDQGLFSNRLPQ